MSFNKDSIRISIPIYIEIDIFRVFKHGLDDGGWSSWSSWKKLGTCPVTCGVGETKYVRTRACDNPTTSRGGKDCEGSKTEVAMKMCSTTACPAQGLVTNRENASL